MNGFLKVVSGDVKVCILAEVGGRVVLPFELPCLHLLRARSEQLQLREERKVERIFSFNTALHVLQREEHKKRCMERTREQIYTGGEIDRRMDEWTNKMQRHLYGQVGMCAHVHTEK